MNNEWPRDFGEPMKSKETHTQERSYKIESDVIGPGGVATVCLPATFRVPQPETGIPGFPETQVFANHCVEFPFTPEFIDPDPECTPHFTVLNVFIGHRVQWLCGDGVSCAILAQRPKIKFDTCDPAILINLTVENRSTSARRFRARIVGTEVRPDYPQLNR